MKTYSYFTIVLMIITSVLSSCGKDEDTTTNGTTSNLQITATEVLEEASSIWIRVDGGTPPYDVSYTAINPTANTDLVIIEEQIADGDIYEDYGYQFARSSERNLSPGTYEFKVIDADGNSVTKTIVNKGFVILYDPTNRLMYDGNRLEWGGFSGDVSPSNLNAFSVGFGEEAYFDYIYPRIVIFANDKKLQNGTNDFPSLLIGSATNDQLQIQLETVSNNEWGISYNTNTVSDQTGTMSIDMIADDSNGRGLSYLKITFNSVILRGWDSASFNDVETVLSGVIYTKYYEGE